MMNWLMKPKQKIKFEGKYNFELQINIQSVDSSSNISVTCYTDKTLKAALPCSYIWFIIKNGLPFEVQGFKGSSFICDTSHIGYYIQAHIISSDAEFNGKAIVTFGPVQLDVSLKINILQGLSRRKLTLPVYLVSTSQQQKESTLQLQQQRISLIHNFSDLSYTFDYSILEPMITPNSKQIHKITILFNQKYQNEMRSFQNKLFNYQKDLNTSKKSTNTIRSVNNFTTSSNQMSSSVKLDVKFLSRSARDTFLFCMKAFNTKRQMKNAAIIRKIQNINFEKEEQFGVITEMDNLKRDLIRADKMFKKAMGEKKVFQDDMMRMQKQMQSLRHSKSNNEHLITQSHHNHQNVPLIYPMNYIQHIPNPPITRRQDSMLIMRNEQLQKQNIELNQKIRLLYNELDFIKTSRINHNVKILSSPVTSSTMNPFSKKMQADNESLVNLLDDLNRSDQFFTNLEHKNAIQKIQSQKQQLHIKLQKSFQHIQQLQRKINKVPSGNINFLYPPGNQAKIIQKLKIQLQQYKKLNEKLKIQNKQLLTRHQQKIADINPNKIENHLIKIRNINKNTNIIGQPRLQASKHHRQSQEIQSLKIQLADKSNKLKEAHIKIEQMSKNRSTLQQNCIRWERRAKQLQNEMQMYRKNQDVLNRSQNMSMQMQNYNEEQIKILREHNDFLVNENEKLVKACQKYIIDAKQNNKLRQEIIILKEKLNNIKTNPENNNSFQ